MPPASDASPPSRPEPESALAALLPSAEAREAALYARLAALGISWRTHAHVPVHTVEQAQALRGQVPGTHTKNLFLTNRTGRLWLVVAREELRLDLNRLARTLAVPRFSFASPALMAEVLGVLPGAVTPFALMNDTMGRVQAIFDDGMLAGPPPLNFHPLRNDRSTAIAAADLLAFARDTGHEPLIAALPERP